ncbi:MFS transporter [Nocardioides panacisoli]|uniref:MFS transporter n=1 Tax=Nocardioides panacisoli TaxID=627624 RepID=UPI001C62F5E6|nr:MFS transporter [Nocardioides panacisoli]QYJ04442.1 MFS transporter [Nocardioides panacisoli]
MSGTTTSGRPAVLMSAASALTTLGAIPPFLLGAQAVAIRDDLGLGLGIFGGAVSLFFGTAAVATMTLSSRFGALSRRVALCVAGVLVAAGGYALSGLVQGPVSLLVAMVVLGLGNAACQATSNLLMSRGLPPGRRGLGFGIKQSAVPLAIMLGGLAVPTVGQVGGWRSTFAVTASVGVAVAAFALLRGGRWQRLAREGAGGDLDTDSPPTLPLLMAGLAITFASAAANYLGAFVASWGFEVGLSPTRTGLLMAAGSAGSILVRVFSGWRADRRFGANMPVVAAQMLAGAVGCLGLMVAEAWAVVGFGLLALSIGWAWPGLLLYAVARLGRDRPARASGFVQAGAFTGGALGPLLLGALSGQVGFPATWAVCSGLFVLAAALVVVSRRMFTADLRRRPPRDPLRYGRRYRTDA